MVDSVGGAVVSMTFVVRADQPLRLVPLIRAEIERRDPLLPITGVRLLRQSLDDSMAGTTFTTLVLAIAALIALILGCVGIYGLISYIVGERTAEIGTRMSLGAQPAAVMRLFLLQAWSLTGAGILIGIALAAVATRLLTSLLFQVAPFDLLTFVIAPAIFLAVASLACLIPASRAASVDPAVAIRRS